MFNSFALAGPFCERMKILPSGEIGCRTCCAIANAAMAWAGRGDVQSNVVDQPVHVSRHHGRVPDHFV
jgi:hypothetical protein